MLNKPVSELNLSVRARKCMNRLGIATLGELVQRTADELLEAKNFGMTSLNEVREKLSAYRPEAARRLIPVRIADCGLRIEDDVPQSAIAQSRNLHGHSLSTCWRPTALPALGRLQTPHGTVETPAFMPVGTQATVKGLTPDQFRGRGARSSSATPTTWPCGPATSHRRAGRLHRFMGWDGPILTDSRRLPGLQPGRSCARSPTTAPSSAPTSTAGCSS